MAARAASYRVPREQRELPGRAMPNRADATSTLTFTLTRSAEKVGGTKRSGPGGVKG